MFFLCTLTITILQTIGSNTNVATSLPYIHLCKQGNPKFTNGHLLCQNRTVQLINLKLNEKLVAKI